MAQRTALRVRFKDSPPPSENYCVDIYWKPILDVEKWGFLEAGDQPDCTATLVDYDVGSPFVLYKWEANESFICTLIGHVCEQNCN